MTSFVIVIFDEASDLKPQLSRQVVMPKGDLILPRTKVPLDLSLVSREMGGVLGIVLGILVGNLTALFLSVPPVIPFDWAALGFVICSAIGVISGVYPAWKASNLDPIESLRYE